MLFSLKSVLETFSKPKRSFQKRFLSANETKISTEKVPVPISVL